MRWREAAENVEGYQGLYFLNSVVAKQEEVLKTGNEWGGGGNLQKKEDGEFMLHFRCRPKACFWGF